MISNNQNTNVQEQETLPFGAALSSGSSTRQFTYYDRSSATGLDYAVNRRYDSLQGRFTQVDPIGIKASSLLDPQSLNMYSYCGNDPINRTDPDGLFWGWFKKFLKRVIVAAIFAAIGVAIVVLTKGAGWAAAAKMFAKAFVTLLGGGEFKAAVSARRTAPTFGRGPTFSQVLQTTPIGRALIGTAQPTPGFNPNASSNNFAANGTSGRGKPLSLCVRKILGQYFKNRINLNDIRLHIGLPSEIDFVAKVNKKFGGIGVGAITIGNNIYFSDAESLNQRTPAGIALIGHELTHTWQQKRGGIGFFGHYLWQWDQNMGRGMSSSAAYEAISYERFANAFQEKLQSRIQGDLGDDPCTKLGY